ncbi:MAG: VCBS repeat-containing protein, partial [Deltaproteobacteria bacterium]|nr:VCBS repeat-containing protein [Deltaproteobacteria bacterium]
IGLGYYQRGFAVADFDNDGDYDIVTGEYGWYGYMHFIEQTSPGVFTDKGQIGSSLYLNYLTMDIAAADFNNDGNYDFIVGGNNRYIYLYTGNGNGTFTTTTITTAAPGSYGRG